MDSTALECKQGEISSEFVRLNEKKENLHDRIAVLFDRLTDIMRKPEPQPEPESAEKTTEVLSSQLAIDLSNISVTVETDIEKINDIIRRLAL